MKNIVLAISLVFVCVFGVLYFKEERGFAARTLEKDRASLPVKKLDESSASKFSKILLSNNIDDNSPSFINSNNKEQILSDRQKRETDRARVFEISRSVNDKSLRPLLRASLENGLISSSEYYGELGHMLESTSEEGIEVFNEIFNSKNGYGTEVMFSALAINNQWLSKLTPALKADVQEKLMQLKPNFSGSVSVLGMADVYRYENWINSVENAYSGLDFYAYLANEILSKAAEPREFLALIYSGHMDRLRSSGKYPIISFVDKTMIDYQKSYPNNDSSNIILKH